jgi:hypothetical protein
MCDFLRVIPLLNTISDRYKEGEAPNLLRSYPDVAISYSFPNLMGSVKPDYCRVVHGSSGAT